MPEKIIKENTEVSSLTKRQITSLLEDYQTLNGSLRKIVIIFFLSVAIVAYMLVFGSVWDIPMMVFTVAMAGYFLLLSRRKKNVENQLDKACSSLFHCGFKHAATQLNLYLKQHHEGAE
ncbi:hypothetical protein I2494_19005 [Budviciaceae bacterium BWR-B9]|uniref:Uncharacterized protein n=1 Tax=Limnobaculum allomyrinae TaxID=2791986 RepID=A0ABS1IVI6_9GAMM|nr:MULTISPECIES: hypothetical protein [Limnobaculum]MBK5145763.1 hypothetical protein [Limnobaculum allomyrinae]MBV7693810.1 hypothetical protein [Limnobaculum sp. M2-1]